MRELFENVLVGLARLGRDGRIAQANLRFAQLLGFEDRDACREKFPRPGTVDVRIVGLTRDLVSLTETLPTGTTIRVHGCFHDDGTDLTVLDVTEEAKALQAISESESRFRALVEGGFEGLSLSVDGVLVAANQTVADMLGRPVEEILGKSALAFAAPESVEEVKRAIAAGREDPYEIVGIRRDGTKFPIEVRGRNSMLSGRRARVTASRDLSTQRTYEKSLQESEARYRELADLLPAIVAELDLEGRFTFINKTGLVFLGYDEKDMLGQNVRSYVHPEDLNLLAEGLGSRLAGEGPQSREYRSRKADGTYVPLLVHSALIFRDGRPTGIRAALFDMTEQHRAEQSRRVLEARVQENKRLESLGLLAGRIAHDFNNILVGILGNASLIIEDVEPQSPILEGLKSIQESAVRAARLTRQLLAYGGKARFFSEITNLASMLEKDVEALRRFAGPEVELRVPGPLDTPLMAKADAGQLLQVLEGLIANAAESGAQKVVVSCRSVEAKDLDAIAKQDPASGQVISGETLEPIDYVSIDIQDDGHGIEPSLLSRLFDPFFTTKPDGKGLGLAAVLGIVRSHRGAIAIRSMVGGGTRASILIPEARGAQPTTTSSDTHKTVVSPQDTVLLIDDEPMSLTVLSRMLDRIGLKSIAASGGKLGLEILKEHPEVSLVILDMNMPDVSGSHILPEIRQLRPRLPVLLSSGYDERDAADLVAQGESMVSFIQKPYRIADLQGAIRALVDPPSPQSAERLDSPEF